MSSLTLLHAVAALLGMLGGLFLGFWVRGMVDADLIADLARQLDECESGHQVPINHIHEEAHHAAYRAWRDTKPSDKAPLVPE